MTVPVEGSSVPSMSIAISFTGETLWAEKSTIPFSLQGIRAQVSGHRSQGKMRLAFNEKQFVEKLLQGSDCMAACCRTERRYLQADSNVSARGNIRTDES